MVFDHAFAEQFTIRLWSLLVSVVFARKASLGFHFWPSILGLIMMTISTKLPRVRFITYYSEYSKQEAALLSTPVKEEELDLGDATDGKMSASDHL